jgi:hypothetical protein
MGREHRPSLSGQTSKLATLPVGMLIGYLRGHNRRIIDSSNDFQIGGWFGLLYGNRRATRPPAHFQRNPPCRGRLAVFPPPRRIDPYESRYGRFTASAARTALRNSQTDLRRHQLYARRYTSERCNLRSFDRKLSLRANDFLFYGGKS